MKIGILILGVEGSSIKKRLVRHSSPLDTGKRMRDKVNDIVGTQKYLAEGPRPMDVGGLPNKGKGKGPKGSQKGKGKGKETPKEKGITQNQSRRARRISRRWKMGHSTADCRKLQEDLKKAEKPAGRTAASASGQNSRNNTGRQVLFSVRQRTKGFALG